MPQKKVLLCRPFFMAEPQLLHCEAVPVIFFCLKSLKTPALVVGVFYCQKYKVFCPFPCLTNKKYFYI